MSQVNQQQPRGVTQPAPTDLSSQIDLLISLHLWAWPALTLAIQNSWGGSSQVSHDKRDWFGGAISELLTSTPAQLADVADLEEVLLQVMVDEFEVVVDDGSAEETAREIWTGVAKLYAGDASELTAMYGKWQARQSKNGGKELVSGIVRGEDKEADDTDWDDSDDEDGEWNGFPDNPTNRDVDMDMDEAPPLIDVQRRNQKAEPEVDEDGFTKVVGKKKR